MNPEAIFENIKNVSDEVDILIRLLKSKTGIENSKIDEEDLDYVIEKLDLYGSTVGDLFRETSEIDRDFEDMSQKVIDHFSITLNMAIAIKQGQDFSDRYDLLEAFEKLKSANNDLYRKFKIHTSLNPQKKIIRKYSESEVESKIRQYEIEKSKLRIKLYSNIDPDFKKLEKKLLQPVNSDDLDAGLSKLFHLVGFDNEIYDKIHGELDIIGIFQLDEKIILTETTTGNIKKTKVDQIAGRLAKYSKTGEIFKTKPTVSLLLVTSKSNDSIDDLARKEAMHNKVGIFTNSQLKELVKLLKKGKLTSNKLFETIRENIPVG